MHTGVLSCFSPVQFIVTPWTVALAGSSGLEFSRQQSWSRLPCLLQEIFSPGIEPESPATPAPTWVDAYH